MNVAHYIAQRARALGLDPNAVLAVARQEGLSGRVGDNGTSFGPFQLHLGGAMPRGIRDPQAWAESPAGINYALSRINSVAHGLSGRQAIDAIVSRFERPANIPGEIAGALSDYGKGGSSPALKLSQILSGGGGSGGGGTSLNMSPQQMMSQFMLQQAQAELGGNTTNPVAAEGTGLLQMAMARKALQAAASSPTRVSLGLGGGGKQPKYAVPGGIAGGFLPKGATYKVGRKDQGQDGQTDPGGPILAPGSGYVISIKSDPNGFGPSYPIVHFTSGPYKGHDVYIGHTLSALPAGAKFNAGAVLSHTGTHGIGNATVPGWFEIGFAPGGLPGEFGQSVPF